MLSCEHRFGLRRPRTMSAACRTTHSYGMTAGCMPSHATSANVLKETTNKEVAGTLLRDVIIVISQLINEINQSFINSLVHHLSFRVISQHSMHAPYVYNSLVQ